MKPFTILLIPLVLGITFAYYFNINALLLYILLLITLVAFISKQVMGDLNHGLILLLFFLLGIFQTSSMENGILIDYVYESSYFTGVIEEVLIKDEGYSRYVVVIKELGDRPIPKEKIILNLVGDPILELGDRIKFRAKLELARENTNPKLFNYSLHLLTDKIYTITTIREGDIYSIDRNPTIKYSLRSAFMDKIQGTFTSYLSSRSAKLMTSIFIGQSSYLLEEDVEVYRNMGLAHILAVSGLHIGIISAFIYFFLSNLGIRRKLNTVITLATIWFYAFLIGFPPSILRANIMFTILYYSQLIHEPYDSINSISFAIFILLLINPYYLFNIGFQLSFMATLSILLFGPRIREAFYPYKNKLVSTLSAILAVQLGTLPVQAYYFNHINPYGIIANLLIIPLLSLGLVLAFLLLFFSLLPFTTFVSFILSLVLEVILQWEQALLQLLQTLGPEGVKIFSPELISIIIYYLMLLGLFRIISIKKLNRTMIKVLCLSLILAILVNGYLIFTDRSVEVHFIDVGQGDAILIRTKGADYLMDTGGSSFGDFNIPERITLAYLEKLGVRSLNALFITHFDQDHSQGLDLLVDRLKIEYLFTSYLPEDLKIPPDIEVIPLKEGDRLQLDREVELEILWPGQAISFKDNNRSLVAILKAEGVGILLTGDIEGEVEHILKDRITGPIDIIKVPHHGSKSSSTEEFLEAVGAREAIISVGRNNIYGHPHPEVLNRYEVRNINIYRTDEMGLVRIIIGDGVYQIKGYLVGGRRYKHSLIGFIDQHFLGFLTHTIFFMLIYIMVKISTEKGDSLDELQ
ncbi:MAG: DNA internalization-related competence protein ComEC/Rec2 [Tissierellia bacterium]|nr:DNA internalization-related competence protein ComEC/Rec2 [Tissierellia bacterium]